MKLNVKEKFSTSSSELLLMRMIMHLLQRYDLNLLAEMSQLTNSG